MKHQHIILPEQCISGIIPHLEGEHVFLVYTKNTDTSVSTVSLLKNASLLSLRTRVYEGVAIQNRE